MEPFYYNHMNKNQQAAYRAMQQGLTNLSDEFQIPRLEGKDLSNVFFELRLDHPEIFWASGFKYKYYPDSPNLILIPEYLFDKGKIREHQKAMGARVEKLARPAMKLTELEKERYIHDFICEHVHYDKLKKPYSHEIIGPLGQGVGVCEGIAKSVKILCDTLGIWCMIALCGNNPEKGIKYRRQSDQYIVSLRHTIDALPILDAARENIESVEVTAGTMDDVFLNVTGKGEQEHGNACEAQL